MLMFWLLAAVLLVAALALLMPALWWPRPATPGMTGGANVAVYRDQLREAERDLAADVISPERFEQLKTEIQRRVLEDTQAVAAPAAVQRPARLTALVLALVIPLASVATYLVLGQPKATAPMQGTELAAAASQAAGQHEVTAEQIERMVSALAERLKTDPDNAEGWDMLGRSYSALERYTDAAAAFQRVSRLQPRNAGALADQADALGMAQGRSLAGEPARLVQQALAVDPRNIKALALAGSVALEAGDLAGARTHWQRMLAEVPADSQIARSVQANLAEIAQRESGKSATAPPVAASAAATGPAQIRGEVVLSPALAARVAAGDTVYVFARAVQGPRLPLAIVRQPVGRWPLSFTLDDSSSMTPTAKLSGFAQVVVGARVSRSGDATPQSGDLIGQSEPVAHTAQGLRVVIDKVQP